MLKILLRAIRAPAVNNKAMLRTAVTIWWAPPALISNQDSTIRARAVVGMLPVASRLTSRQSIVRLKPCTRLEEQKWRVGRISVRSECIPWRFTPTRPDREGFELPNDDLPARR